MNRVYRFAWKKMIDKCEQGDVVLLGTKDLMHIADRVFIQENDNLVRKGFKFWAFQSQESSQSCYHSLHRSVSR
jgi:hypothetical protein